MSFPGQLAAGTCEIVTLDRDSSQPRRTIARQTARCACKKGQIAGTTRARPACVDAGIVRKKQWCEMVPCLEDEGCDLLVNKSGWTCTQPGGRVKTTTLRLGLMGSPKAPPSPHPPCGSGSVPALVIDPSGPSRLIQQQPKTIYQHHPTTTTNTNTTTTTPPKPWSRKGRKQHKQPQSTKSLMEAARFHYGRGPAPELQDRTEPERTDRAGQAPISLTGLTGPVDS
ncbi:Protein FAM19A5 [Collichthys lucidus]|uniref:Protein FAM19A5 n=1 Tax=Collichthys lucidus TaxID=240159 RepID=A0A4V6AUG4_COLLU|nr:Protein FAM19A5 [Collichthys lucidus]